MIMISVNTMVVNELSTGAGKQAFSLLILYNKYW